MKKLFVLSALFLSITTLVFAQIRLPKIIGSNMVLQQEKPVAIWGYAEPSSSVIVQFGKQKLKATTNETGKWEVHLQPMKANKQPQKMTIKSNRNKVVLDNILVGEVWLASGQSNMEYRMDRPAKYLKPRNGEDIQLQELEKAHLPLMRILYVEKNLKTDSLPTQGWKDINKETIASLSAPAYFFGKTLIDSLNVPVGIISTSWGGTMIETWTPEQAYLDSPVFKEQVKNHNLHYTDVGKRFDHMVREMIPFTLKGFIWYQGESNLMAGHFDEYVEMKKILIHSWRSLWMDATLPFYYVQIAPYIYSQRRGRRYVSNWESLPRFWEKQAECMNIPYTGMVVTTDLVDEPKDIHPPYKCIVGHRLALWALAHDYKREKVVYSGPQYKSMSIEGNKIILEFDNIGSGLTTKDGKALNWFQISGDDDLFQNATAVIKDNKVVLFSPKVSRPVKARFAWDEIAKPNFCNIEGLPAIPFRTDTSESICKKQN